MTGRNETEDLHKLAGMFFSYVDRRGSYGVGIDSQAPFGRNERYDVAEDILLTLGIEAQEVFAGRKMFSSEQIEYALDLLDKLPGYLRQLWTHLQ